MEGSVYASFVYSHPDAGVDSVNLTISNKNVEPFQTYSIEVTRYIQFRKCLYNFVNTLDYKIALQKKKKKKNFFVIH